MRGSRIFLLIALGCSLLAPHLASGQDQSLLEDGQAKAAAGDIQGALAVFESMTREHPDSAEAFAHLGGMQLLDQRYREAVQSFQQAVSLGVEDARAFIGMGMAYLHLGQLGPARAALVEAQHRGTARPNEVAELIAWIDRRGAQAAAGH